MQRQHHTAKYAITTNNKQQATITKQQATANMLSTDVTSVNCLRPALPLLATQDDCLVESQLETMPQANPHNLCQAWVHQFVHSCTWLHAKYTQCLHVFKTVSITNTTPRIDKYAHASGRVRQAAQEIIHPASRA